VVKLHGQNLKRWDSVKRRGIKMTDYDSELYGICISTAKTGSGTTAYPSGDRVFFITDKINLPIQFLQKIKDVAGGYSYSTKDGKMSNSCKFGICILVGGKTAFNTIIPKIKDEHAAGQGLLYLFLKDLSAGNPNWGNGDNTLYIGYTAGAETNYMSGFLLGLEPEIEGKTYWIKNLNFKECGN